MRNHIVMTIFFCFATHFVAGSARADGIRGESPYMLVTSEGPTTEALPLKSTEAAVDIAGVIAHVRITQEYQNTGSTPIEAVYVFPGSTRAAVFGLEMQIGGRKVTAKIDKAAQAKALYEAGKQAGKTASLLEQKRPNVFQMNVANILPGDSVKVVLDYTELIEAQSGVYEFVYPAIVGPRYGGESKSGERWHKNPYLTKGTAAPYRYGVDVRVAAGMGIQALTSPSHQIKPKYRSPSEARFRVSGNTSADRDLVLRYRLRGGAIQTGMLRYDGPKENFFLMMVQPPKRVAIQAVPPREYVFIVDVSGSMSGFPLDVSKALITKLLEGLRATDRFNLLFFAGGNYRFSERSVPATANNIARAKQVLAQRRGGGGTNLLAALRSALAMPASDDISRSFVAITDGYITVEKTAFGVVRKNLGNANFFAFGIGSSVNRHLIEGLARAGRAEAFVVLKRADAAREAARFRKLIATPALTNIQVSYSGFDAYDVERKAVPDLFADKPVIIYGKYRGPGTGTVTITGSHGQGKFRHVVRGTSAPPAASNRSLGSLWARKRIQRLEDGIAFEGQSHDAAITKIGLRYNLLTRLTSFVAVDSEQRTGSSATRVVQPLPLPRGVTVGSGINVAGSIRNRPVHDSVNRTLGGLQGAPAASERVVEIYTSDPGDIRSRAVSADTLGSTEWSVASVAQLSRIAGTNAVSTPTLLRYGITDRIEARLGSDLLRVTDSEVGQPDLVVGAKVSAWRGRIPLMGWRQLHVSALADFRFDFDDTTLADRHLRTFALVNLELAEDWNLRTNLGLSFRFGDDVSDTSFAYGAELAYYFGRRWGAFASNAGDFHGAANISAQAGILRSLGRDWQLGINGNLGITEAADDLGGGLFLRWRP